MRKLSFLILLISCIHASSIVYDPYGDLNTSEDDADFAAYLDYITATLTEAMQSDSYTELASPISQTGGVGFSPYKDEYTPETFYVSSPTGSTASYEMFNPFNYWEEYSSRVNPNDLNTSEKRVRYLTEQKVWQDSLYDNFQSIMLGNISTTSSDTSASVHGINQTLGISNFLIASGNGKLDSISTLLNRQNLNNSITALNTSSIDEKLGEIKDILESGGDFTGFDTSTINVTSQIDLDAATSFMDNFQDNFTDIVNDATSIKTDFDNVLALVNGSDLQSSFVISSSSTACNINFNLAGHNYKPLEKLPDILNNYSAIFSLFVYIALMIGNFKFLFKYFSLGVR